MKATITSVKPTKSKFGGVVYLITFSGEDGKSYMSWVSPANGNFEKWKEVISKGEGTNVDGLKIKKDNLINADSTPIIL